MYYKIYVKLSSVLSKHISIIGWKEACKIDQGVQNQSKLYNKINQCHFQAFKTVFNIIFSCNITAFCKKSPHFIYKNLSYFNLFVYLKYLDARRTFRVAGRF